MPGSFLDPGTAPERRPLPGDRSPARTRRRTARTAAAGAAAVALVLPLLTAGPGAAADAADGARADGTGTLQQQFTEAARSSRVPERVLLAVSYLQSRWDTHQGAPSVSGGYGPMHLTDARAALAGSRAPGHSGTEDARGDTSRPARTAGAGTAAAAEVLKKLPQRLRTLKRAAELTGLPREELRTSAAANVRGGAALLASAQKKLGRPLSSDPADWYDAVAAYPGGDGASGGTAGGAPAFADDVFDVLRRGEDRTTDSGDRVTLKASPGIRAGSAQAGGPRSGSRAAGVPECPGTVDCEWDPAPYEKYKNDEGEEDYGNHDTSSRPASQRIDHIVVHDVEGSYESALKLIKDPQYVSWNYTMRASDGHVAQHVRNKDTAWHAGNWYINSKSVGIEHEGFLTDPDAWYTEAMYRSSARLVKYLSRKYGIPLDRQHVLGHDNVPGTTPDSVPGMHTDPGPYWDWQHYFTLLGKPFVPRAGKGGGLVTVRPDFGQHKPVFTGCDTAGKPCPEHGSGAVRLHTAPDESAPLVNDVGLRPGGGPSTTEVNDTGARASTGQQYAVAGRQGEWTAIWYLGQKAWFHNPQARPTAVPAKGSTVEPEPGKDEIPVYGRAYPEKEAYPEGVPVQALTPLPYKVLKGQRYAAGPKVRGEYLYATEFDPDAEKFTVVRGKLTYYQIQLGHRVAYVRADDVRVTGSR